MSAERAGLARLPASFSLAAGLTEVHAGSGQRRLFLLPDDHGCPGRTLIVDLNRVTFIDSAGLGALVGTARRVAEHGGSLHAVCSQPQPRRLLWMTGVDRRIPLAATVDEVLMSQAASRNGSGSGT